MKNFLLITIVFFVFGFYACNNEVQDKMAVLEAQYATVPSLLDRPEALMQGKEWEKVQRVYVKQRDAIIADKSDAEARLKMAEVYVHEARVTGEHGHYYPAALSILEPIQDDETDKDIFFRALTMKAGVYLSLHEFDKALVAGEQAVRLNPYSAQVYGVLVDAYVELGQYDKAVAAADQMVSIRPDLRSYARVSYLREIHGHIDGAIEAMEMAVKAGYPGYEETAWTRLTLGELYEKYSTLDEAEQQYLTILEERSDYPFAIAALAAIEISRKNYEEAEAKLKEACSIIPEFGFYESLAILYKETGRKAMYQQTMEEIWVMLKEDTDSGHNMTLEYASLLHELEEDHDGALKYALEEYNKRPDNIDVNRILASIYTALGDGAKAEQHFEKAIVTGAQYPSLKTLRHQLALK